MRHIKEALHMINMVYHPGWDTVRGWHKYFKRLCLFLTCSPAVFNTYGGLCSVRKCTCTLGVLKFGPKELLYWNTSTITLSAGAWYENIIWVWYVGEGMYQQGWVKMLKLVSDLLHLDIEGAWAGSALTRGVGDGLGVSDDSFNVH